MNKNIILGAATVVALASMLGGSAALAAKTPTAGVSATGTIRAAAVKQAANARKAMPKVVKIKTKVSNQKSVKKTNVVNPTATGTVKSAR